MTRSATFDATYTKNFTSVRRPAASPTGVYCITPGAGINPATSNAFVTVNWGPSIGNDLLAFIVTPNTFDCTATEFSVRTYNTFGALALSNSVQFRIFVP